MLPHPLSSTTLSDIINQTTPHTLQTVVVREGNVRDQSQDGSTRMDKIFQKRLSGIEYTSSILKDRKIKPTLPFTQDLQLRLKTTHSPLGNEGIFKLYTSQLYLENTTSVTDNFFLNLSTIQAPAICEKLLFNIMGDHIGSDSRGNYSHLEGLKALGSIFELAKQTGDIEYRQAVEKQINLLNKCISFGTQIYASSSQQQVQLTCDEFRRMLLGLGEQESLVLPGGWAGYPGHAMVYELKKSNSSPGTFQLQIFNLGKGISYHTCVSTAGRKEVEVFVLDKIDIEKLVDPIFIKTLQHLCKGAQTEEHVANEAEAIYDSFLHVLGGERKTQILNLHESRFSNFCNVSR